MIDNLKINILVVLTVTFTLPFSIDMGVKQQLQVESSMQYVDNVNFNLPSKVESIYFHKINFLNTNKKNSINLNMEESLFELRFKFINEKSTYIDVTNKYNFMDEVNDVDVGYKNISHHHNITRKIELPYTTSLIAK